MCCRNCESSCILSRLNKFIFGKKFDERSLLAQEKLAETGLLIFDKIILGALVWLTLPFVFNFNLLMGSQFSTNYSWDQIGSRFFGPMLNSSFFWFWLSIFLMLIVIAEYVRRVALDHFDNYSNNKHNSESILDEAM